MRNLKEKSFANLCKTHIYMYIISSNVMPVKCVYRNLSQRITIVPIFSSVLFLSAPGGEVMLGSLSALTGIYRHLICSSKLF